MYPNGWKFFYCSCKYGFPKAVISATYIDEAGYARYRRRSVDDCDVVPYNSDLLRRFKCHINVESSATVLLIMYLYKYFYKGVDYTSGNIVTDEICQYIKGRYLSASEAVWRLFEYEVTRREPSVARYPVHLEGENYVVYEQKDERSKKRAGDSISKLERYFMRPLAGIFGTLKYLEYYEKYMVTSTPAKCSENSSWKDEVCAPNISHTVYERTDIHISRMDTKMLNMGEVWYLRLVLRHKAARSYE